MLAHQARSVPLPSCYATDAAVWCNKINITVGRIVKTLNYPHMPIGKVWIYRLLFVCFLFVCTVTDLSGEDTASVVKFCTVVHRRPEQGIFHFGELCSPKSDR